MTLNGLAFAVVMWSFLMFRIGQILVREIRARNASRARYTTEEADRHLARYGKLLQEIADLERELGLTNEPSTRHARHARPCDRPNGQVTNVCVAEGCYNEACLRLTR